MAKVGKHRYKLTYKVSKQGLSVNEIRKLMAEDHELGACDALLVCSLIYPGDGSFSCYFLGADGRKEVPEGEPPTLEDVEWFKVWTLMARRLSESTTLDATKKDLALRAFESVRSIVLGHNPN